MGTMINEGALAQLQERASVTKDGWLNDGDLDDGIYRESGRGARGTPLVVLFLSLASGAPTSYMMPTLLSVQLIPRPVRSRWLP